MALVPTSKITLHLCPWSQNSFPPLPKTYSVNHPFLLDLPSLLLQWLPFLQPIHIFKSLSSKKLKTTNSTLAITPSLFPSPINQTLGKKKCWAYLLSQLLHPSHILLRPGKSGILPHYSNETSHLKPLTTSFAALILFDLSEATDTAEHSLHIETHSTSSFCGTTFSLFS